MGRYQSHLSYSLVLNHKLNEYDYFLDIECIAGMDRGQAPWENTHDTYHILY
jgi:hypothetical protein